MSKLLYQANPSVWRTHPFGTLVAFLVVLAGIFIALTGQIPYVSPLLAQVHLPVWADPRYLGYALIALGLLRLIGWWLAARFDHLEIREKELVWTHGFLNKNYTETNMASIRTVRVHQSLFQRMVNAGDLVIFTTGDVPELAVKGLPRPNEIREHIKRQSAGEA
ncbi:MAG: PH domain-containing protein [Thiohalocapsa sp.]